VGALVRQLSEQAAAYVCTWETVDGLTFRCIFLFDVSFYELMLVQANIG
jgi:hypothetical protein